MNFYNPYQIQPQNLMQGKMINNVAEITANDIPMNGTCAYFPMYDGSMINVRRWNSDGTITQMCYKPITDDLNNGTVNCKPNAIEGSNSNLTARLEHIEKLLEEIKNDKSANDDTKDNE